DDAFQHLRVKANHYILTTTFHSPYYKDWVFPAGMLREPRAAKHEASMVVVTKCPQNLKEFEAQKIKDRLKFSGSVFFTTIHYGSYLEPVFVGATIALEKMAGYKLVLITGIAQPKPFVNFMSEKSEILKHFAFVDHYHFKEKDLRRIADFCSNNKNKNVLVVTTQKDAVRLTTHSQKQLIENLPIYYSPIELQFLFNQEIAFQKLIKQYAKPD
ncbi:MAG: tetraacyldisaccharide 4'-kinase, partial [Bacteroidetes bacterium]|nr:tetraacyldisaccharide 4'-kinase [Bacteroidota bacterium]